MGMLVDGKWQTATVGRKSSGGRYKRPQQQFRNIPGQDKAYPISANRYHLYVSLACPWAHRTLIMRALKGLEVFVPLIVLNPLIEDSGWSFAPGPKVNADPNLGASFLWELYVQSDPGHTGRVTVPVLWDTHSATIVNNESADILRIFNSSYDDLGAAPGDYYPADLRDDIDSVNERVYETLNNGVYKCGFARSQQAYDESIAPLFATLDWLDAILADRRYLLGDQLTEADIRLFTTLVRFDLVYTTHFKCSLRRISDYAALSSYLGELYQNPAFRNTVDFDHITTHYYRGHRKLNPRGIVPAVSINYLDEPRNRTSFFAGPDAEQ